MEDGIQVLYVDDEPGLLEITRIFLEKNDNFHVSTAISAQAALASIKIPSYDAIISDYMMPEMDGIAFLKTVRKQYGDLPFILFTGRGREEIVVEAINNGVDFYLQKGGDPRAQFAELAHKVRQAVLRKRTELSRKRAEIDLRESEEKYRSLVELVPDAVLVHREGTVVYVNPECVRLVGANTPDDLIGQSMMPFIHPDDQPMARQHLQLMKENGVTIPLVEERLLRLDGGLFTVEITAKPVLYQGIPSVIVVFRDITDRKKKEDELRAVYEQVAAAEEELRGQYDELARGEQLIRESEEKYRNIIENAPYGMHFYELGPNHRLVFTGANPSADRILGVSHDQFIGKTLEEAFPGLAGTEVPDRYLHVAESGVLWQTEQVIYDARSISGAYAVTAFRTASGAMAAMFVDITDRKKKEFELQAAYEQIAAADEELRGQYDELARGERLVRESQERLRSFLDSATDAFSIWDADLNLVDLNPAALAMLPDGTSREGVLGRNLAEFMSGSGEWNDAGRYRAIIQTGIPFTGYEKVTDTRYGRRWLNVRCFRVGDGLGIVTSDITREKEANEKLGKAHELLAETGGKNTGTSGPP